MKTIIRTFFATASLLAVASAANAQDDRFANTVISAQQVSDNLYVLFGDGGNIGLSVGDDGAFMIDDQYAPLTPRILAAIAEITDQPVKYVLNTHWHGDHTGGNENLGKRNSVLMAHDNVRKRMAHDHSWPDGRVTTASPKGALPVITFDHHASLHINGDEARAKHYANAHTDGDSIVFFSASNVVHMGDIMFHLRFPFIDFSSGGTIDGMIGAVKDVLSHIDDKTIVIPGHGPVTDKAGLMGYLAMLELSRERIAALKEAGKSLEEAIAAKPMADHAETWDWGFIKQDRYVELVYRTLP